MDESTDTRFLPFFLREPIYVVDEPEPVAKPPAPSQPMPELPCRGNPQSEVLIVVHEPNHEFLSPADQAFLEKILRAVSLRLEEVVLVNGSHLTRDRLSGFSLDELLTPFAYRIAWALGDLPEGWSVRNRFRAYEVSQADGRQLLLSDPLSAIVDNVDKKARLWKCLQALFARST